MPDLSYGSGCQQVYFSGDAVKIGRITSLDRSWGMGFKKMAEGQKGERAEGRKGRRAEGQKGGRAEGQKGRRAEGQKGRRAEGQKGRRAEGFCVGIQNV